MTSTARIRRHAADPSRPYAEESGQARRHRGQSRIPGTQPSRLNSDPTGPAHGMTPLPAKKDPRAHIRSTSNAYIPVRN